MEHREHIAKRDVEIIRELHDTHTMGASSKEDGRNMEWTHRYLTTKDTEFPVGNESSNTANVMRDSIQADIDQRSQQYYHKCFRRILVKESIRIEELLYQPIPIVSGSYKQPQNTCLHDTDIDATKCSEEIEVADTDRRNKRNGSVIDALTEGSCNTGSEYVAAMPANTDGMLRDIRCSKKARRIRDEEYNFNDYDGTVDCVDGGQYYDNN